MKILFVSHQSDFIYGGEIVTLELMRELKSLGHDVHFATPAGDYFDRAAKIVKTHKISSVQFRRRVHLLPRLLPALFRTKKELRQIIEREKISVVHATSLKAMVYCWRLRKYAKIVWHHHDIMSFSLRNGLWLRGISKAARKILTPSLAAKTALIEADISKDCVDVLYNGFVPKEWTRRPERSSGKLVVGIVGEISSRKGTDLLPKVIQELERQMPAKELGMEFWVIGEGLSEKEFAEQIKKDCANYVSSGLVRFLGRREDVKKLYQEMDVLLVPSRQDPFPTVILEAMFSGVPVVGANVGGIPEMIVDGKTGCLTSHPKEMARSLLAYRDDASVWNRHSVTARERAEQNFSIHASASKLAQIYENLR